MVLLSCLSTKGRTTQPKLVWEALGVRPGNHLLYEVGEDGTVRGGFGPGLSPGAGGYPRPEDG